MRTPPILAAQTAAEVAAILGGSCLPGHIVDVSAAGAVDLLGSWHLASEGGDAVLTTTPYAPRFRGMHTNYASTNTWIAASQTPFNFGTGSWAVLFVNRFYKSPPDLPNSSGGGGFFIGNMKGPKASNPILGDGLNTYGDDRGWGISANGDGGMGFQITGTTGLLNCDLTGHDFTDGKFRVHVLGYNATLGFGFMTGAAYDLVIDPDNPGVFTFQSDPGDITSTDGIFALRCEYPYLSCHATQDMLRIMSFTGAAAEALYAVRNSALQGVQHSLDPLTTVADIRRSMMEAVLAIAPEKLSDERFREFDSGSDYLRYCEQNPAGARRLCFVRSTGDVRIESDNTSQQWVVTELEFAVCHPRDNHAGDGMGNDRDALIEHDLWQIDNAIGTAGYSALEDAASATVRTIGQSREETDACVFGVLRLEVGFWKFTP